MEAGCSSPAELKPRCCHVATTCSALDHAMPTPCHAMPAPQLCVPCTHQNCRSLLAPWWPLHLGILQQDVVQLQVAHHSWVGHRTCKGVAQSLVLTSGRAPHDRHNRQAAQTCAEQVEGGVTPARCQNAAILSPPARTHLPQWALGACAVPPPTAPWPAQQHRAAGLMLGHTAPQAAHDKQQVHVCTAPSMEESHLDGAGQLPQDAQRHRGGQ